jgi:hypothetical protein
MQRLRWTLIPVLVAGLLVLVVFSPQGRGQSRPAEDSVPAEPTQVMTQAMDAIVAGQYEDAYIGLRKMAASPLREMQEAFDSLAQQTQKAFELWGKPTDYALARWESAGPHLIRLHYVVRCPKHPIHWRATFYRPGERWELINIALSEDLAPMFGD